MTLMMAAGYGLTLASLGLGHWYFKIDRSPLVTMSTRAALTVALPWILFAIVLRLNYIFEAAGGFFVFEEMSASIVYIDNLLRHETAWAGATQMVYYLVMDAWRLMFGMNPIVARGPSFLFGIATMAMLLMATRRLVNTPAALFTAGFLGLSMYGVFFSTLILEPAWTMFFFALALYVYSLCIDERLKAAAIGLILALGTFTYPSFVLWTLALAPASLLVYRGELVRRWKLLLPLLLGAALFAGPTLWFHFSHYADRPLLQGGGVFLAGERFQYFVSLWTHILDLWWKTTSYYLLYTELAFVEYMTWGFFGLGVWRLIILEKRRWAAALLISMVLTIPLSAFATNLPGMRRAIVILAPYYMFVGVGFEIFVSRALQARRAMAIAGLATALVTVALGMFLVLEGRKAVAALLPYNVFTQALQSPGFREVLKRYEVQLIDQDPDTFNVAHIPAYVRLLDRYTTHEKPLAPNFTLVNASRERVPLELKTDRDTVLLFANPELNDLLKKSAQYCTSGFTPLYERPYRLYAVLARNSISGSCR
ncbi:MAG TPA: glycosyltransferase family 39 protein [Bdellovibrionales bacterium]|nr:glycosyltransferase family 39 protein [Bdellovibrionales bacterium]